MTHEERIIGDPKGITRRQVVKGAVTAAVVYHPFCYDGCHVVFRAMRRWFLPAPLRTAWAINTA